MEGLIVPVLFFGVFWLLFVRPQQRRVREHQRLMASISVGDEVVTTSGIYGVIRQLDDEAVRLEVAPGVQVRIARAAIGRRTLPDTPPDSGPSEGPIEDTEA